jgi:hypothetical protein
MVADLQGGLLGLMSDPSNQFYLSLLANSNTPGGIGSLIGKSAQQGSANWQDFMTKQLALQQAQSNFGVTQAMNDAYTRALQQSGMPQAPQAPQQAPPQGLLSGGPAPAPQQAAPQQQSPPQPAPQQQPDSQDPGVPSPMTPDLVHQIPVGGVSPTLSILAKARANGGDFAAGQKEVEALQYEQAQRRYMPTIAAFDNIIESADPAALMKRNMTLSAAWPRMAAIANVDPSDKSPDNVRYALNAYRNALASGVNLPEKAPAVKLQNRGIQQVNPITGKIEHEEDLEKVVDPKTGRPMLVPKSQAAGMTPYNQFSSATDDQIDAAAQQVANYKVAPPTGGKLLSGNWPAVMARVKQLNPNYDATFFATKNKARMAFATGKQGDTVRSLSVATDHLDQLQDAANALKNGDISLANRIANTWGQQTGHPEVTNFNAMVEIVGDEVAKAVIGSGAGGQGDREGIKKNFNANAGEQQISGAIAKYKGLMGSQLNGLRRQYKQSTGLDDFDDMISPTAQAELGGHSDAGPKQPPATNARGWTLHQDKNGNMAYVSPDGKQFEEVK